MNEQRDYQAVMARRDEITHSQPESAVIAWLRHQTTAYDNMKIARVKGKRREVRRMLSEQSRLLLKKYRDGHAIDQTCPLRHALSNHSSPDCD